MTATNVTQARRRREKEQRKEAILTAARKLFFGVGFHRVTVEDIAAEAGVAKGTVYLYFESKETILAHCLLEGLETLEGRLAAAYVEETPLPAETRLRRLAAAYLEFFNNEQDHFQLMMAFDRGKFQESVAPDVYQQILLYSVRGLRWVVKAMQQGQADGDFAIEDAKRTAGMFWAAVNGALVIISHPLRRELLKQEVEMVYNGVLELVIRGMKKQ